MSKNEFEHVEILPGTIFELDDMAQLRMFEDFVALRVSPTLNMSQWVGREPVRHALYPSNFQGSIRGPIRLVTMQDPFERFHSVEARGLKLLNSAFTGTGKVQPRDPGKKLAGFDFLANAYRSLRGREGEIRAEMYFGEPGEVERNFGRALFRVITKPVLHAEGFMALDETARRIGPNILRQAMYRPVSGTLPDNGNKS